jgi:hypothetical protein
VWVAVVYDLIAKYRELTTAGDSSAAAFLGRWDGAHNAGNVSQLLSLERCILRDATHQTQMLNRMAETHLARLREDRHLCAHPAFSTEADLFEPSPELARLHLVNAIELVLSQEPLHGRGIFEQFNRDLLSIGFPREQAKIITYVEQRYLARVRPQNVRSFGAILAKSLLVGAPLEWEPHAAQVAAALIAVRERRSEAWGEIAGQILRLLNGLGPSERTRAIAFLGIFPDFWDQIDGPVRITLTETAANLDPRNLTDFRVLAGVRSPAFRRFLERVIEGLDRNSVASALATSVLPEIWPRALKLFGGSGSYRTSESNFRELIAPFATQLSRSQVCSLLDAITANGQNWAASATPELLLGLLRQVPVDAFPGFEARDKFYRELAGSYAPTGYYAAVWALFEQDGWAIPSSLASDSAEAQC